MDVVKVSKEAAKFIEINYPNTVVFGDWPEVYQLTQSYQGFVGKPISFYNCQQFNDSFKGEAIIYRHQNSLSQRYCGDLLKNLTDVKLLRRFVANGRWIELYKLNIDAAGPS